MPQTRSELSQAIIARYPATITDPAPVALGHREVRTSLPASAPLQDLAIPPDPSVLLADPPEARQSNSARSLSAPLLNITDTMTNLHIFSNVLDVESFDYAHLYNTIFKKQEHASHVILAVSHDRNFSGGTARIENIYEYATQRYVKTHNMKQSAYKFFSTYDSRGREVSHVSWWLDIEQLPVTNS